MRLAQLLTELEGAGEFRDVALSARTQFGTQAQPLLGARLLPEQTVDENAYREERVRWRSVIASVIDRYSPPPKESSAMFGGWMVELAESGRKTDLTARELDALMRLVDRNLDFDAGQRIVQFVANGLTLPIAMLNEKQRWDAMVDRKVVLSGENTIREDVLYPNPAGNRVTLSTLWDDPASDAPADLFGMVDFLKAKGISAAGIYSGTRMWNRFLQNAETQKVLGGVIVASGGTLTVQQARANADRLRDYMERNNLPPWTIYDGQYTTRTGTGRYLRNDAVVIVGSTDESTTVDLSATQQELLPNTLGYYAIGRAAGRPAPGRHVLVRYHDDHPPRVEGEIVQTGLPVITQPDAIAVLSES